ncbi:hypothetical protein [Streptomyces chartreusis]|uniref:hypothetical protein n=1 Tax=Streptomyces chartreusis TaxID=1969 RepID=UPI002E80598E|nr:hypothetical protein [Streptomyces chartreusis]WUB19506.1 hypothetical protein OG997_23625 [Streptomyces chartreusis]WUB23831.1 hypothetical protein OG997_44680 [Streptomyces chartreusis]
MTDSTPPGWVDDLFPFPTPPALRTLIDIAWQDAYDFYQENESYDYTLLETHYDFMFDLATIPRPPDGCETYPELTNQDRQLSLPHYATPEFVPFGSLGDGGYVGWLVPAPELGRLDHPVALANGHQHGVTHVGADTRTGLEFMLSRALRRWREDPVPEPPAWRDADVWFAQNQWLIDARAKDQRLVDRLAAELRVHPDPDRTFPGSWWKGTAVWEDTEFDIVFDVPEGWRHEPGADGIGVLAPVDAYVDRKPVVEDDPPLEPELIAADCWLDAGYPATALLALKDTFVKGSSCYFADLAPLWARAYRDLGRPEHADRLDLMAPYYQVSCYCPTPH